MDDMQESARIYNARFAETIPFLYSENIYIFFCLDKSKDDSEGKYKLYNILFLN